MAGVDFLDQSVKVIAQAKAETENRFVFSLVENGLNRLFSLSPRIDGGMKKDAPAAPQSKGGIARSRDFDVNVLPIGGAAQPSEQLGRSNGQSGQVGPETTLG
jgi:hypothetical protein